MSATNLWLNVPAWRHQNGDTLAFADGHVEYWKWRGALPVRAQFPPIRLACRTSNACNKLPRMPIDKTLWLVGFWRFE
jgi:prepilin-type processing-associated H-X9-DG protein